MFGIDVEINGGSVASILGIIVLAFGLCILGVSHIIKAIALITKKDRLDKINKGLIEGLKQINKNLDSILQQMRIIASGKHENDILDEKDLAEIVICTHSSSENIANLVEQTAGLAKKTADLIDETGKLAEGTNRLADSMNFFHVLLIIAFGVILLIVGAFKW